MKSNLNNAIDPRSLIDFDVERQRNRMRVPRHSEAFYEELRKTLAIPSISSCIYHGLGDCQILEILSEVQLVRQCEGKTLARQPLEISVFNTIPMSRLNWGKYKPILASTFRKSPDIFINDYPWSKAAHDWFVIRRSTAGIVFSSCPQSLMLPSEGTTSSYGYFMYMINHMKLAD